MVPLKVEVQGGLALGVPEDQQGSWGAPLKAALPKISLKCFLQWTELEEKRLGRETG